MPTCFVIQPFDSGKFDKRFDDVYKPAIEAAGLDAYRVDRDPKVEIAIEAIEEGIRNSAICLADVTTVSDSAGGRVISIGSVPPPSMGLSTMNSTRTCFQLYC